MTQSWKQAACLAIPVLGGLGLVEPAGAVDLQVLDLHEQLQAAVCQNNWEQAIRVIEPLMVSSSITPEYRQELTRLRENLVDLRADRRRYENVPGCDRSTRPTPSRTQTPEWATPVRTLTFEAPRSAPVQEQYTLAMRYRQMRDAACQNDWDMALDSLSPLLAASDITPEYRVELTRFRRQLQGWQASDTRFEQVPGC